MQIEFGIGENIGRGADEAKHGTSAEKDVYKRQVMFNFHPGSHVKQGTEIGIPLIADALNEILSAEGKTLVLLETMAGKGSEVGRSFEELRAILDREMCIRDSCLPWGCW